MKKSLFTPSFVSVAKPVLAGFVLFSALLMGTTSFANAQEYYGNYSTYGASQSYQTCISLTSFQGPWSTDAQTGGQVTMLQQFLNRTGYLSGVSGTYDNGTLGAVINFQRAYGIQITGTVGPITRAAINQQSCGVGIGGYNQSAYNQYSYPVTQYSNGNNCYWTGGTYNSTYVCTSAPVAPIVPVAPVYPNPIVCNSYNNGYNNYNNGYNNAYNNGYCGVVLNSLSSTNTYNGNTITIRGSGFSASGNTVYFGNSVIANAYSSDGVNLTFTVPTGYYSGTYGISVKNASGVSSNTLSYIMSNTNYWNNNNNNYNTSLSLSNISGPSGVQTGVQNIWTVTASGSNNSNVSVHVNWGDNNNNSNTNDTQQAYTYGSQTLSFSHVYQTSGTYTIRMTVTDSSGNTAYSTYSVTVNGNGYNNYYSYRGY